MANLDDVPTVAAAPVRAKHVRGRPLILPKPAPTTLSIDRLALPARLYCHLVHVGTEPCAVAGPLPHSLSMSRVLSSAGIPRSPILYCGGVAAAVLHCGYCIIVCGSNIGDDLLYDLPIGLCENVKPNKSGHL